MEPVPTTPSVTGVAATDAKTLTVTFDKAISAADQALATFDVKRGTTATTVVATWAADGLSVDLARTTNLIAGTYTVTVNGIELGTKVATTEVEAQKIASLEIITSNVTVAAAAQVNYKVYDQYGDELAKNANTFNWSVVNLTDASRTVAATAGAVPYVTLNTLAIPAEVGDVVRVTGLLVSDPTVVISKDITVSNIFTNTFTLGDIVLPEGSVRLTQNAGWVELPYTATDNFGNAVTLSTTVASAMSKTIDGIQLMTSDNTIIDQVRVDAAGKLEVRVLNKAGNVSLIALNGNTGATSTKAVTVNATPVANTATFGESEIIDGDAATRLLPVTFFDQYGVEMAAADVAGLDLTAGPTFNVSVTGVGTLTVGDVSADGKDITFSAATEGTYTLTLTNKVTGATSTTTVVVGEQRLPNELQVVTAPDATIPTTGTTTVTFKVVDQYGDDMTFAAVNALSYTIDAVVTGTNVSVGEATLTSYSSTITGDALGTDTVTYTLNTAAAVAVDNQAFNFTVIDPLASLVVTTDNTEYTAGQQIGVTIKAEKAGNIAHTTYNTTGVATVTVEGVAYLRNVTFVNGTATTTVPATQASTVAGTPDITVNVAFGGFNDDATDVEVIAAAASKLSVLDPATDELFVTDAYGNQVDYDFTGIATVTNVNGTLVGITPNSENQAQIVITDGEVFAADGTTNLTYVVGADDSTLTFALSNGTTFAITLEV